MSHGLLAGLALSDITPEPGLELAGYPHHPRSNTGAHDPLCASCLCLDDGATRLAIVCMDLFMYSKREVQAVREAVSRVTSLAAGNIMIACSHTHSGPWASGRLGPEAIEPGLDPNPGYLAHLRERLVSLVRDAWEHRFPARIGIDRGFCGREQGVGGNRRNPNEIADPEAWVIAVEDRSGNLRGCLLRYALHPTFLHSDNTLVSADYPGSIRSYLAQKKPGMIFLFAQGTSGNMSPRYFRTGTTYAEATRVGQALGEETVRVLDSLEYRSSAPLLVRSAEITVDIRTPPKRAEAEQRVAETRARWQRLRASGAAERDVWNAELRLLGAEHMLVYVVAMEEGKRLSLLEDECPAEVQVLGIGDARIVGLPGEIFLEFGMTIQYRAPFDKTLTIELANGCLPGYACTARAYAQGGYEADTSLLTGRSGEQLVDAAVSLLESSCGGPR